MDDVDEYAFPLLVELQKNTLPKVNKNKLVKYFQSRKSNGGECEVDYDNVARTAVVRFRREEDRTNVLSRTEHDIALAQGVLRVTVRLPNDDCSQTQVTPTENPRKTSDEPLKTPEETTQTESRDDDTADKELYSTSAVLRNVQPDQNKEYLGMLVANIMKGSDTAADAKDFTLEVIPEISSVVVTFCSRKANNDFIENCPRNRIFKSKELTVQYLEVTAKIRIEGLANVSQDHLILLFENEGAEVENVLLNMEEQSAIITFKDPKAVSRIIEKKIFIKQTPIKVFPFYESLGSALYGKDRPVLKLPSSFTMSMDDTIWRFLHDKQDAAEIIHSDLESHFCKVDLQKSTVSFSPLQTLIQRKGITSEDINKWMPAVKTVFKQALSRFKSLKLQPLLSEWENSEGEIRLTVVNEPVVVVPDKNNNVLFVVGFVEDVTRLEQTLTELLRRIATRAERAMSSVTEEIQLHHSMFHILCQDGLKDKIMKEYPELQIEYNKERKYLTLHGLKNEILGASKIILEGQVTLKQQTLQLEDLFEFVKYSDSEHLTELIFTSKGISATLKVDIKNVQILAVSDKTLNDAEDQLKIILISHHIEIEDSNVLNTPEWKNLVTHLEDATNDSFKRVSIQTSGVPPDQQIVVSGFNDSVVPVSKKLTEFLSQNAQIKETVVVKHNTIVKYIEEHQEDAWMEQFKDKVRVGFKKDSILLSGSRVYVISCKNLCENLVSSLFLCDLKIPKPGAKKLFQEKEQMYVMSARKETGSFIQLVDENTARHADVSLGQGPKPIHQLQTSDGVEIAIFKADLCSFPVGVVINAATKDLKHSGGLALALLNAAGPQLQKDCDDIVNQKGTLKPGDCVITSAGGQLRCRNIIHAVIPVFEQANPQKYVGLLKRAVKGSLELSDNHNCQSVAIPAIGRNQKFPLNLCADTITKALKDYLEDKYGDHTLKRICLVNNDDIAVQAMLAAVTSVFGNHGVSHPQQGALAGPHQSPKSTNVQSTGSSDKVLTKEGLTIILKKGHIQDAAADVIVNTVAKDLTLNKGAVSSAILGAAGDQLQTLVKQKNATANYGDVITTTGCMLVAKHVFHAVVPHWDSTAEKILKGVVNECLGQAEDNRLTSITFPAIGTGNLNFPKDQAASVMLDGILKFSSSKQPKHLKTVTIMLYPRDAQTIQVFKDEFEKRFSPNPSSPRTTQSTGPFSKITSSSGMHETKLGNVTIQVVTGDITTETTDIIVNSSNESFSLKSGVSKAIMDAAGQAVEAECVQLSQLPNQGIIMTQPGNLKCKKILHLVGQTEPTKINKVVNDALQMCVKDSYTSVSFPAIGTGQGNLKASQVADAMLDAMVDICKQNAPNPLKMIRIVIFQKAMLTDFHASMKKKEDTGKGFLGSLGSKLRTFIWGNVDKQHKDEDFVIEPQQVEPACFHICGDSQAEVDMAKKWISDLISKDQVTKTIRDEALLSLSPVLRQRIMDMQATMAVSMKLETNKGKVCLTIEGMKCDVGDVCTEIYEMLRSTKEEEDLKKRIEIASNMADWQYEPQGRPFQSFDPLCNLNLEEAWEKNQPHVEVKAQGQLYKVAMPNGPATDNQGNILKVRRIDKLKAPDTENLPSHWDAMPANTICHQVIIQPGTQEHTEVLKHFQVSCNNRPVLKIERIQNPILWMGYQIKKQGMEQKNGHQNNERCLFHGTCYTTVAHINQKGFNRSYAGVNATVFGKGVYFAVRANYSASDTYSKPDPQGQKFIYFCRVLVGDFTQGAQNMIVPPNKTTNSIEQFDSVVDNPATPTMFIIFHDNGAYPEYLITFK